MKKVILLLCVVAVSVLFAVFGAHSFHMQPCRVSADALEDIGGVNKLDTPFIVGLNQTSGEFLWQSVSGADKYIIFIDGREKARVLDGVNSVNVYELGAKRGQHRISIQAVGGNLTSDRTAGVLFRVGEPPNVWFYVMIALFFVAVVVLVLIIKFLPGKNR